MGLIKKLLTLALMIAGPIISGKAFYEYAAVRFMNQKPSFPFGRELMKTIQIKDVSYLATYESELLTIGCIFLAITVLAYISMMIKALVNMVWLAAVLGIGYLLFNQV
jgi:hypothetical protein